MCPGLKLDTFGAWLIEAASPQPDPGGIEAKTPGLPQTIQAW